MRLDATGINSLNNVSHVMCVHFTAVSMDWDWYHEQHVAKTSICCNYK